MAIVRFRDLGSGAVLDASPTQLADNAWSLANNITFRNRRAERSTGWESTLTVPLNADATFISQLRTNVEDTWIYGTGQELYRLNANNHELAYTAPDAGKGTWTTTELANIMYLSNGSDTPKVYNPANGSITNVQNYPSNTTAYGVKSWKGFLFTYNLVVNGVYEPQRLMWSDPVLNPDTEVSDWEAKPTNMAGSHYLQNTDGGIRSMLELSSSMIIYAEDATHRAQFTGGDFIFSFEKLFDFGIISENGAASIGNQHIIMTPDDVLLHDGTATTPIAEDFVKATLFADLDEAHSDKVVLLADQQASSAYIFIPTEGSNGKLNKVYTYDYDTGAWATQDIPTSGFATLGYPTSITDTTAQSWDELSTDWDNTSVTWDSLQGATSGIQRFQSNVVLLTATDILSSSKLYSFSGENYISTVEKLGITLDGTDVTLDSVKRLARVYPIMEGNATVNVFVAAYMNPSDTPNFKGPFKFNPVTQSKVDCRVSGRYLAIRVESTDNNYWSMDGFDLDIYLRGKR